MIKKYTLPVMAESQVKTKLLECPLRQVHNFG